MSGRIRYDMIVYCEYQDWPGYCKALVSLEWVGKKTEMRGLKIMGGLSENHVSSIQDRERYIVSNASYGHSAPSNLSSLVKVLKETPDVELLEILGPQDHPH